jgi:hypothetical protein
MRNLLVSGSIGMQAQIQPKLEPFATSARPKPVVLGQFKGKWAAGRFPSQSISPTLHLLPMNFKGFYQFLSKKRERKGFHKKTSKELLYFCAFT